MFLLDFGPNKLMVQASSTQQHLYGGAEQLLSPPTRAWGPHNLPDNHQLGQRKGPELPAQGTYHPQRTVIILPFSSAKGYRGGSGVNHNISISPRAAAEALI